MPELPHALNRTVLIKAPPETVFRFFTDPERWALWWGPQSSIEAQPGGRVYIRHPNGVESLGEVLEVRSPEHIVFTYGFASGKPIPPGASRVTIRLEPDPAGTRLTLLHEFPDAAPRDEHVQGWRFQLSVFANVVANEVYADAAKAIDGWFEAWTIADTERRTEALAKIVDPAVRFEDRYSLLAGVEDVAAHIGAAQRFMPGIAMTRDGDVRHCQGTVIADWIAIGRDRNPRMGGTNVFTFGPDRRVVSVVGFANRAPIP